MWFPRRVKYLEAQPHRLLALTSPFFQHAVEGSDIVLDGAQRAAVADLSNPPARGFYLWGSVGRGKSMLCDLYFDALPTTHKRRFHFHSFFRQLHSEIAMTRQPVEKSIGRVLGPAKAVLFQ